MIQNVATEFSLSEEQVEIALFADRPAHYTLTDVGLASTPIDLLAPYNLELARGVLYWANHLQIEVTGGHKDLWKYLKLFKLMFWAQPTSEGYRLELVGFPSLARNGMSTKFPQMPILCSEKSIASSENVLDSIASSENVCRPFFGLKRTFLRKTTRFSSENSIASSEKGRTRIS